MANMVCKTEKNYNRKNLPIPIQSNMKISFDILQKQRVKIKDQNTLMDKNE